MKQALLSLILMVATVSGLVFTSAPAYAVDVTPSCSTAAMKKTAVCKEIAAQNGSSENPIVRLLGSIISIVSYVVGAAAVIGIIVSGLRMMLANGDSSAIANARSSLIYCLIGVLIAAIAQLIVVFVINNLN